MNTLPTVNEQNFPPRDFSTLRLSLTPFCNFSCLYCKPTKKKHTSPDFEKQIDSSAFHPPSYFSGMIEKLLAVLPLKKIRLTGGEPLLYPRLPQLISLLKQQGINEIALTTNGSLTDFALLQKLKFAGLTRINFSLDTLSPQTFSYLSGQKKEKLKIILQAIDAADNLGLQVKINFIVIKNINSDELVEVLQYFGERNITLRFLELMRMGYTHNMYKERFMSQDEILNLLRTCYTFSEQPRQPHATATYFALQTLANANKKFALPYSFGIIANDSAPFCSDCDRLRLDSFGNLFGCISSTNSFSLHQAQTQDELKNFLQLALQEKRTKFSGSMLEMIKIGG